MERVKASDEIGKQLTIMIILINRASTRCMDNYNLLVLQMRAKLVNKSMHFAPIERSEARSEEKRVG